jgi:hypothetical protein
MLIGGVVVSAFAILSDVLRPKRFAGLFGAAPSVALASLALTVAKKGNWYAATESRSMIIGAIAFLVYSYFVLMVLFRGKMSGIATTLLFIPAWLVIAFSGWFAFLRQ